MHGMRSFGDAKIFEHMPAITAMAQKLSIFSPRHLSVENDLAVNMVSLGQQKVHRGGRGQRIRVRIVMRNDQNPSLPRQDGTEFIQLLSRLVQKEFIHGFTSSSDLNEFLNSFVDIILKPLDKSFREFKRIHSVVEEKRSHIHRHAQCRAGVSLMRPVVRRRRASPGRRGQIVALAAADLGIKNTEQGRLDVLAAWRHPT